MTPDLLQLLKRRGYARLADGSFARPDSERKPAPPAGLGEAGGAACPPVEARGPSALERKFEEAWRRLGGPALVPEFQFHPERKWRFDFAHLASRTAIELEGLTSGHRLGRHQRKEGAENDMEKYFEAQMGGWSVIRLCRKMLDDETLARLQRALALKAQMDAAQTDRPLPSVLFEQAAGGVSRRTTGFAEP